MEPRYKRLLIVATAIAVVASFVTPVAVLSSGRQRDTAANGAFRSGPKGQANASAARKAKGRPNIVVVMSDDQDVASLRVMSNVQGLLERKGTTFLRSYASYPLCCPSRATFLTGQYAHNHGVFSNVPPNGGYHKLNHTNTLPIWLQRAGYYTGHIGKYLNGYGTPNQLEIPPGWSEWYASFAPRYYGYRLNENGHLVPYSGPGNYETDVLDRKAVDFIRRRAPSPTPFFLNVAPNAPHDTSAGATTAPCSGSAGKQIPPQPAPRHAGRFKNEPLPMPPSFNEQDYSDKPAFRSIPSLDATDIANLTRTYRCRLESLLAVDEAVRDILVALRESGELENTLVIYTSDNGFLLGQHRVRGKVFPYQPSIRVPLVMRGPGVPKRKTVKDLVANIDLAPTIVDAANASPGLRMDGRSLFPLMAHRGDRLGRAIELEAGGLRNNYRGVLTQRYMYAEYANGDKELYDLTNDLFELRNAQGNAAYGRAQAALAGDVGRLKACGGGACQERPRASLRLHYRRGRVKGRRCVRGRLRARITGHDAASVERVKFELGGRGVARDNRSPFRRGIGRRHLKRGRKSTLRALLILIDGREMTLDRKVRGCR
jgi:N-acetylglucosamine-6-sulfatase